MFILDTTTVSELRRGSKANAQVLDWAENIAVETTFVSCVTVMELEIGTLLMERRDARQGLMLRRWLEGEFNQRYSGRILSFDDTVSRRCARLHVPNKKADRDAMIAATALVHGMTVVTRNVADFAPTGVQVLNPWV